MAVVMDHMVNMIRALPLLPVHGTPHCMWDTMGLGSDTQHLDPTFAPFSRSQVRSDSNFVENMTNQQSTKMK